MATAHSARRDVAVALANGDLIRQPCEECGATRHIHAHHPDYNQPLVVQWLCPTHHSEVHGQRAGRPRTTQCARGHPWTPENTYLFTRKNGRQVRNCRKCRARQ